MGRLTVKRIPAYLCVLAVSLLLLSACGAPSRLDSLEAGKTTTYAPGVPNFDMEAIPVRQNENTGVKLYIGVPFVSFSFQEDSALYKTPYRFSVEVHSEEGGEVVRSQVWTDTVAVSSYEQTQRYEPLSITRWFDLDPGAYVFRATLEDLNSESHAVRMQRITVPDYSTPGPKVSPIHLEAKRNGQSFQPVVALHIPSDIDSLRAVAELYNLGSAERVDVTLQLRRFRVDLEPAQPPDALTPLPGSLEYEGIDYGEAATIQTEQYAFEPSADTAQIIFDQPPLEAGIYRVEITAEIVYGTDSLQTVTHTRQRTLSIKGPNFPRVTSLEKMIGALTYIAHEDEIEKIRSQETVAERRRQFDAFWGKLAESREEAAHLIEAYYSRVEEANRFFTGHKAGWKTDRGMLYVVYGPPLSADHLVSTQIWYYGYSDRNPRDQYRFERGKYFDTRGPLFQNFILERRPYYRRPWTRAIQDWRDGEVPHGV